LTIDNGLSDNSVTSIVQDKNGFIWIGTENGLNRYDGSQFVKFFRGDKPTDLPGNHIAKLVKMQGNYLGIATDKGAVIFNTRTNECKRLAIPSQKEMELFANEIYYVITNTEDELIISTRTGVFVFNDQAKLIAKLEGSYTINDTKTKGIGFAARSVLLNHDTTLINTDKGIAFYDSKSKNINYLKYSKNLFHQRIGYLLDSIPAYSIGSANKNLLFFLPNYIHKDTLCIIDFNKQIIRNVALPAGFNAESGWESTFSFVNDSTFLLNSATNGYFVFHYLPSAGNIFPENKKLFPENIFYNFYTDKDNRLWAATTKGILKQSFSKELFNNISLLPYTNQNHSLAYVKAFYRDERYTYIGLDNNKTGVMVFDKQNRLVKQIDLSNFSVGANVIWSITSWNKDTIAIATQEGLFFYNSSDDKILKPADNFSPAISAVPITSVLRDKNDNNWFGLGRGNGVLLYNNKTKYVHHFLPGESDTSFNLRYPNNIAQDISGNVWFIRSKQGLIRWNNSINKFDTLIRSFNKDAINYFDFFSLDADKTGNLWIGFLNYGLMQWNLYTHKTKMYTVADGLADNSILAVFAKVPNQVWVIYRRGIGVLNTKTGGIKNFDKTNGLPDYAVTSFNLYYDSLKKQLMVGSENVFTVFDPFLVAKEKAKPKVYITEIKVPGDFLNIDPDKKIALKDFQNNLSINFSAIDFDKSSDINYEYRLYKNETTPWIKIFHEQTVNLGNLSPGDYTFQVRVAGDESSLATEKIYISFPFYETWWFYALLAIVTAIVLYALYRYRIDQLLQLQKVRNRISADLHDDIGARLTNINLLSALSEQKLYEPKQALDYLKRIEEEVQTSGEALDDIVWSINTKNDSVEEITLRMRRYAADVFDGTNIHYSITANENVLSEKLSMEKRRDLFLVYKEAINNIFKHAMATEVQITIDVRDGNLLMQISDNGKGFDIYKPTHRNGLKNIRYRVEKSKGDFTIQSVLGKGTTFIIKLPYSDASLKRSIFKWFIKK